MKDLKNYLNKAKRSVRLITRRIVAQVAGVTFEGRQEILAQMNNTTPIKLERDRSNEFDFFAVKVLALVDNVWQHVGFIPGRMSDLVANTMDKGVELDSSVCVVKGGIVSEVTGQPLNYGLDIFIAPREV